MTVSDILIAFFLSFGFSMLISLIAYKATGISYAPGDATKAAEELTKQMKEFDEIAMSFEQIDMDAILDDFVMKWQDGIGFAADWDKPLRTVKLSDHSNRCRCAYCGTLNDHETGVCDRCGAPLP